MARRRSRKARGLGQALTFEELPVGACFAFSPTAKHATGKKTSDRHALAVPGGTIVSVRSPRVPVRVMSCRGRSR